MDERPLTDNRCRVVSLGSGGRAGRLGGSDHESSPRPGQVSCGLTGEGEMAIFGPVVTLPTLGHTFLGSRTSPGMARWLI